MSYLWLLNRLTSYNLLYSCTTKHMNLSRQELIVYKQKHTWLKITEDFLKFNKLCAVHVIWSPVRGHNWMPLLSKHFLLINKRWWLNLFWLTFTSGGHFFSVDCLPWLRIGSWLFVCFPNHYLSGEVSQFCLFWGNDGVVVDIVEAFCCRLFGCACVRLLAFQSFWKSACVNYISYLVNPSLNQATPPFPMYFFLT